ncbi:hypothetical protein OV079_16745 [Nannocystis pusilla]|uniref:Uncharacterized protein n=1 Tax=Nannocystis pusilla TaxID=889268 RepID=A0A9X3EX37_9BACT|nr:hypothetical protein [Nannocystis pusilla]MCY1007173.1 hypothetical protein [Nannocystis pusilla]
MVILRYDSATWRNARTDANASAAARHAFSMICGGWPAASASVAALIHASALRQRRSSAYGRPERVQ